MIVEKTIAINKFIMPLETSDHIKDAELKIDENQFHKVQDELSKLESYESKLSYLMTLNQNIDLDRIAINLPGYETIDLTPTSDEQVTSYNQVIKMLLLSADDAGEEYAYYQDRFTKAEYYIEQFTERIESSPKEQIIESEIASIFQRFRFPLQKKSAIEYFIVGTENDPGAYIDTIQREWFQNLMDGYRDKYANVSIHWRQHAAMIHVEEIFKYYMYLLALQDTRPQSQLPGNKLPQRVIALIEFYSQRKISPTNCHKVAEKYGWTSENSGQKIYDHYTKIIHEENRINTNGSTREARKKIQDIQTAITQLNQGSPGKNLAETELKKLKNKS